MFSQYCYFLSGYRAASRARPRIRRRRLPFCKTWQEAPVLINGCLTVLALVAGRRGAPKGFFPAGARLEGTRAAVYWANPLWKAEKLLAIVQCMSLTLSEQDMGRQAKNADTMHDFNGLDQGQLRQEVSWT